MGADHHVILPKTTVALEVGQAPDVLGPPERDTHFLLGLAFRSRSERRISGFQAATGERHMTRPRIPRTGCPLDEQNLRPLAPVAQNDRHSGAAIRLIPDFFGLMGSKAFADSVDSRHSGTIARGFPEMKMEFLEMDISGKSPSLPGNEHPRNDISRRTETLEACRKGSRPRTK